MVGLFLLSSLLLFPVQRDTLRDTTQSKGYHLEEAFLNDAFPRASFGIGADFSSRLSNINDVFNKVAGEQFFPLEADIIAVAATIEMLWETFGIRLQGLLGLRVQGVVVGGEIFPFGFTSIRPYLGLAYVFYGFEDYRGSMFGEKIILEHAASGAHVMAGIRMPVMSKVSMDLYGGMDLLVDPVFTLSDGTRYKVQLASPSLGIQVMFNAW